MDLCFREPKDGDFTPPPPGVFLLQLTATASAGGGYVSEAVVLKATGGLAGTEFEACVPEQALLARFEWEGAEGEVRFKLPVKVEP